MTSSISFASLPLSCVQLSLAAVLQCGQSFRWQIIPLATANEAGSNRTAPHASGEADVVGDQPSHEYRLALSDRVVCLRQTKYFILYRAIFPESSQSVTGDTSTESWIRDYFQLDVDLEELYRDWSTRDPVFDSIKCRFSGIRILKQDPWENLVSFICSANNNISRISKMVQSLCENFSEPLLTASSTPNATPSTYYTFPPPSALAPPSVSARLRNLAFGYRAEYIQRTAQMLLEEHGSDEAVFSFLKSLRSRPMEEARSELLKCMGVGRKVADCVLLMGLDKKEVVPVDTHVLQIAQRHYKIPALSSKGKVALTPKLYDDIQRKLASVWGGFAGWAHTVLFTADLKKFENYGLDSQLPTPPPTPAKLERSLSSPGSFKSTSKRKREAKAPKSLLDAKQDILATSVQSLSTDVEMIDRVKRRKRLPVKRSLTDID